MTDQPMRLGGRKPRLSTMIHTMLKAVAAADRATGAEIRAAAERTRGTMDNTASLRWSVRNLYRPDIGAVKPIVLVW
ncbi:hypothetical protein GCM10010201_28770 [Pilimelia columellifera subsp. columellifera]|uniref:Uncharacterized protein n=1 Tax=Pilimelia columellifera subsp. columellifera TaxID=706583 RepID=A0ABP6AYK4_9ACTN